MLAKFIKIVCFCQAICFFAVAQNEPLVTRKMNHYIGLQANQLIRQILNLGGSNTIGFNPYFIAYAMNSSQTGHGLAIGFGYNYNKSDNSDQFTTRISTNNSLSLRIGYEKKYLISPKIIGSLGIDLIADTNKSGTETKDKSQAGTGFDFFNKSKAFGGGPRVTINYALSEKIIVGTEANYYFRSVENKLTQTNIIFETVFDPFTGQSQQVKRTNETTDETKSKSFFFNAPVVIYLILKLR